MKLIYSSLVIVFFIAGAQCSSAVATCRDLHGVDFDFRSTFANSGCRLSCVTHDRNLTHNMNDGRRCQLASNGFCQNGTCVLRYVRLGNIDVAFISARLSRTARKVYATSCSQNFTAPAMLPIQNRASCVSCSSNLVSSSSHPHWNNVCAGSGRYVFVYESSVTFEVWEHQYYGHKMFLGGATLTIPDLIRSGHNGKRLRLKLRLPGGAMSGHIKARVTWMAK